MGGVNAFPLQRTVGVRGLRRGWIFLTIDLGNEVGERRCA